MTPYRREFNKVSDILESWNGQHVLRIHVSGEDGHGREEFIRILVDELLAPYLLVGRQHLGLLPVGNSAQLHLFSKRLFASHPGALNRFLAQAGGRRQAAIEALLAHTGVEFSGLNRDTWIAHLFALFLASMTTSRRLLLLLEDLQPGSVEPLARLKGILARSDHLPLLLLTSGSESLEELEEPHGFNVVLSKISIREAEKLTIHHLNANEINARVITNHCYLKSRGQLLRLQFMLETYYRPLVEGDSQRIMESSVLREVRPASSLDGLFQDRLNSLDEPTVDVLAFLARLERGFPRDVLLEAISGLGLVEGQYDGWLQAALIQEQRVDGTVLAAHLWPDWKHFLRSHTGAERIHPLLNRLSNYLTSVPQSMRPELSGFYFDIDELPTALRLARQEALMLAAEGEHKRALDRYGFITRNMERDSAGTLDQTAVLSELGDLQSKFGIYQNAFESYRDLRALLPRTDSVGWMGASLKMARMLFQMDALTEVRYLIKEVKFKDAAPPPVRFEAALLNGELEQNSGHADYALKHFQQAFDLISDLHDDREIYELYVRLRDIYGGREGSEGYAELAAQTVQALDPSGPYVQLVELDRVRHLLDGHQYAEALTICRELYRDRTCPLFPGQLLRVSLYLSECYGYRGKWRLARSYLARATANDLLTPTPRLRVELRFRLAVVDKELNCYGSALTSLQLALDAATTAGLEAESNRIRAHLGHLHLLVHSFLRAREYLLEARRWAEQHQDDELMILTALFLASYELHQGRHKSARQYCETARIQVELGGGLIDRLNLLYYTTQCHLAAGESVQAAKTAAALGTAAQGIEKYETIALWMSGVVALHQSEFESGMHLLTEALSRARASRIPAQQYQILLNLIDLHRRAGSPQRAAELTGEAEETFEALLTLVEDKILIRQLLESREYESLQQLKKKPV